MVGIIVQLTQTYRQDGISHGTTEMNDYELDDDNEGTLFIKKHTANIYFT
jgi:hypothetical protein